MAGTADVIAFDRNSSAPAPKQEFTNAIHHWINTRDVATVLSRVEIGELQGFDRIDAHRKAYLLGLSMFCRDNPRADVVMSVYAIVMFLSDNDKGMCTLSQSRIAELLHRKRQTISDAMRRLKEAGLIQSENGKAGATPVIPRAVCAQRNHVVWLVDALTCPLQPTGQERIEPVHSSRQVGAPVNSNRQVTCPLEPIEPVRYSGHNFTKENSTTLDNKREREDERQTPRRVAASIVTSVLAATAALPAAARPPEPVPIVQAARLSLQELTDRMMDAGGKALANPAGAMGLLTFSEQSRWLSAGCDIDLDILPTIAARAAKSHPASIRSWSYFTQAVADAKARRTAPMPEGNAREATQDCGKDRPKTWHEKQDAAYDFIFSKKHKE